MIVWIELAFLSVCASPSVPLLLLYAPLYDRYNTFVGCDNVNRLDMKIMMTRELKLDMMYTAHLTVFLSLKALQGDIVRKLSLNRCAHHSRCSLLKAK